jgi:transcriptional regulator with XRE-family HTH domain
MPDTIVDVAGLIAALDAQRKAQKLSWRKLAEKAGVSASTLTRMQQGKLPDVNTFTKLTRWLRIPAEQFLIHASPRRRGEPHPLAVASTLLRGKREMSPRAMEALEELVQAAFKLSKELD